MSKRLLSLLIVFASVLMFSAATASADEIALGASNSALGVTCTGGSCTLSISGSLGSSTTAQFDIGNPPTDTTPNPPGGSFWFTGGPTILTTSNGGTSFNVDPSSTAWGFSFDDNLGDTLSGTVSWTEWDNATLKGFNTAILQLNQNGLTCTGIAQFCSDFANGGLIDMQFNLGQDLGTLYNNGGSESGSVSSGEITPASVPEPGSLALFGSGLIGIASFLRRKITRS
jgi:PEP-CTERM motif